MKKIVTALGLVTATLLTTQGAYANDAEKIAVVKAMFNYELDANADYDDRGFAKFLSKDFQKTIIRQQEYDDIHRHSDMIDDCETDTGGLIITHQDGLSPAQAKHAKNTAKYTVTKQGYVQITFKYYDEHHTRNFRLINEGGKWKVDDFGSNGYWWKKSANECLGSHG